MLVVFYFSTYGSLAEYTPALRAAFEGKTSLEWHLDTPMSSFSALHLLSLVVSKSQRVDSLGFQGREKSDIKSLRAAPPEKGSTAVWLMCSWDSHDVQYTV